MKNLTKKQSDLAEFIRSFAKENGQSPTFREIMCEFGYTSTATVSQHLQALITKGVLTYDKRVARSIQTLDGNKNEVAVMGIIRGSSPLALSNDSLSIPLPSYLEMQENLYGIRIEGTAFLEECIAHGDILVVEGKSEIQEGARALLLVNDRYSMIKTWQSEGDLVRLTSIHPKIDPLILPVESVTIQGQILALERRY